MGDSTQITERVAVSASPQNAEEETKEIGEAGEASMASLLEQATEKWLGVLAKKGRKESTGFNSMKRYALAKKIMKDLRKFFCILFAERFERKERKGGTELLRCVRKFVADATFLEAKTESSHYEIAHFLKPNLCKKLPECREFGTDQAMQVYEKMNTENLRRFFRRPVYCTLTKFVFASD